MSKSQPVVIALIIRICVIILAALIIGSFIVDNIFFYAKGLFLGGIFTILRIKIMEITLSKALNKNPEAAKRYINIHYFFRYVLTFVVLVISILEPTIHPVGVIIGLLSMKLAVYWHGYRQEPTPKDGSITFVEWEDDEEENSDF